MSPPEDFDVMISYEQESGGEYKEKLIKELRNNDIKVLTDTEQMHGYLYQHMAEGVASPKVMVVLLSAGYVQSDSCNLELQHAHKCKTEILYVKVEKYNPPLNSAVSFLLKDSIYYKAYGRFDDTPKVIAAVKKFCQEYASSSNRIKGPIQDTENPVESLKSHDESRDDEKTSDSYDVILAYGLNSGTEHKNGLLRFLAKHGLSVCDISDEKLCNHPEIWTDRMAGSSVVVLLLSKDYSLSEDCKRQLENAICARKKILPVKIDNFEPDEESTLGQFMRCVVCYELFENYNENVKKIIKAVKEHIYMAGNAEGPGDTYKDGKDSTDRSRTSGPSTQHRSDAYARNTEGPGDTCKDGKNSTNRSRTYGPSTQHRSDANTRNAAGGPGDTYKDAMDSSDRSITSGLFTQHKSDGNAKSMMTTVINIYGGYAAIGDNTQMNLSGNFNQTVGQAGMEADWRHSETRSGSSNDSKKEGYAIGKEVRTESEYESSVNKSSPSSGNVFSRKNVLGQADELRSMDDEKPSDSYDVILAYGLNSGTEPKNELLRFLTKDGLSVCDISDEQLCSHPEIWTDRMAGSRVVVLLLSKDYSLSEDCTRRLENAIHAGKKILPVKIDNFEPREESTLGQFMRRVVCYELFENYNENVKKIIKVVKEHIYMAGLERSVGDLNEDCLEELALKLGNQPGVIANWANVARAIPINTAMISKMEHKGTAHRLLFKKIRDEYPNITLNDIKHILEIKMKRKPRKDIFYDYEKKKACQTCVPDLDSQLGELNEGKFEWVLENIADKLVAEPVRGHWRNLGSYLGFKPCELDEIMNEGRPDNFHRSARTFIDFLAKSRVPIKSLVNALTNDNVKRKDCSVFIEKCLIANDCWV